MNRCKERPTFGRHRAELRAATIKYSLPRSVSNSSLRSSPPPHSPKEAMGLASLNSRKNLVLVDRWDGTALTHDLVGTHNGCKVVIRAVPPGRGMKGSPLTTEILYQCGIADASVKAYGNRNPYSVVRATFKALKSHEGVESVARKRGKRIMSLQKAYKLGIS